MTLNHPQAQTEEQRYLLAVLGSNDGVWDWDFKTGKIFFSDRWKSMLGYLPEEIGDALQDWESRVHPDDLGWVTQAIQAHWAGESELFSVEHRLRHKGGHYLWVLGRGRSQFDDAGTPVRMTGTHVDVTERRATREPAKTLSDELQTILNLSPDGFVAFDRLGKVKCVTPAFETLTLLGARQVLGLTEDQFWDQMASVSKPKSKVGNVSTVRDNLGQANSLRRSLIEALIDQAVMAQEAVKTGLDKQAPVVTQLDLARQNVLVQAWQQQVLQGLNISDADLKQEYQRQVQALGREQVRLRHVLLSDEKQAQQVQVKLKGGADFEALAKQHSGDSGTREQGGLSGWLPEGRLDPALVSVVRDLKVGQLAAAPVKTAAGWQVVKLEERGAFVAPAMDKVEPQLRQAIALKMLQGRLKELRDGAKLEFAGH
jgi:PAS domain S-box-containing protein